MTKKTKKLKQRTTKEAKDYIYAVEGEERHERMNEISKEFPDRLDSYLVSASLQVPHSFVGILDAAIYERAKLVAEKHYEGCPFGLSFRFISLDHIEIYAYKYHVDKEENTEYLYRAPAKQEIFSEKEDDKNKLSKVFNKRVVY